MVPAHTHSLGSVICHEVSNLVSCIFDELVQRLSAYSWAQAFAAVDWLSWQGTLKLGRVSRFGYVVSVDSDPPPPQSSQDQSSQALFGQVG